MEEREEDLIFYIYIHARYFFPKIWWCNNRLGFDFFS
jgi:hypothetical protein